MTPDPTPGATPKSTPGAMPKPLFAWACLSIRYHAQVAVYSGMLGAPLGSAILRVLCVSALGLTGGDAALAQSNAEKPASQSNPASESYAIPRLEAYPTMSHGSPIGVGSISRQRSNWSRSATFCSSRIASANAR